MLTALRRRLGQPVDNAPLVVWRVLFGLLMLLEAWGALATGWVRANLVLPEYTFPFLDFAWLAGLAGPYWYGHFAVMGLAALGVLLGWRYRLSALALALLWSMAYFAQKTSYNNHYYLAVLLVWAMALVPEAAERLSLDARRRGYEDSRAGPPPHSLVNPYYVNLGAKLMLLIVFSYGALAKLYPGWLNGDFIGAGFAAKAHYPVIGPLLAWPPFQTFITWGALVFDATVIPLLWWRRTRWLAFGGLVAFDLFNSVVFQIGIFPYLVLAFTVFFFRPDQVARWFRLPRPAQPPTRVPPLAGEAGLASRSAAVLFLSFFTLQLLLPLRHHLLPGDVNFTDEAHRLSWRMMTRSKYGRLHLEAVHPVTGDTERVPSQWGLTPKQARHVATKPDFLYAHVQRVKRYYTEGKGWPGVELYARRSAVWLNGRGPARLFRDSVDLAKVTWQPFRHHAWVEEAPEDLYER